MIWSRRPLRPVLATFALAHGACGFSLPGPTLVRHPYSAYVEVPYPPPAALPETVSTRPAQSRSVWVEGSWKFRRKSYTWQRGGWFIPPAGAHYARSEIYYPQDGRVMFAPGLWYDASGQALDHIRPVSPAGTPKNEFTSEAETAR